MAGLSIAQRDELAERGLPGSFPYVRGADATRDVHQGWRVTDCVITMTHSGYVAPSSSARDFRLLTPLVLTLVAALYPSWRASKVNPAEALRYE